MRPGTENANRQSTPSLQSEGAPLLPPPHSHTNLNEIADIIRRTKKTTNSSFNHSSPVTDTGVYVAVNGDVPPEETSTQSLLTKMIIGGKALLPYPIFVSRFGTCSYRALPNADAIIMGVTLIPGLEKWQSSKNLMIVADSVGGFFALTDGIQTLIASKDKVFELCEHPNWMGRMGDFIRSVRAGHYPVPFLVLFMLSVIPGSMIKGYVGLTDMIQRLDAFAGIQLSQNTILSIVLPITLLSCVCSSAFLFQKSAWVVRAFKELEGHSSDWDCFRADNKSWIRKINVIGVSQATVGAFATGIAMFYNHHNFQFEVSSLIFFLLIGVTSILFNYKYCYNPVYLLESILEKQRIEAKKQQPEQTSQNNERSCWSIFRNVNAFFSVAGGAIVQCPAFVRSLQVIFTGITLATGDNRFKNVSENSYFLAAATIISLFFAFGAFVQGMAMWASPSEKKSQETTSQPAVKNTSVFA